VQIDATSLVELMTALLSSSNISGHNFGSGHTHDSTAYTVSLVEHYSVILSSLFDLCRILSILALDRRVRTWYVH
jgi:hypothetical protein